MLSLESPQWSSLEHAYGSASDIPELLAKLASLPSSANDQEPWFSLWSALAHQGDVYSASFAAVPHVIDYLATDPERADSSFFHFPAWVEVCRIKQGKPLPDDLKPAYLEALSRLPSLLAQAARSNWDDSMLSCALGAVAAAKGFGTVAEAILEMNSQVATDFLKWHGDR